MADERIERAIEIGSTIADEVLQERREALRERAARSEARGRGVLVREAAAEAEAQDIPEESRALLGAAEASAGVLIAEGDSWFDYPFHDVLELLERRHA